MPKPAVPTIQVIPISQNSVIVSWQPITDFGGGAFQSYVAIAFGLDGVPVNRGISKTQSSTSVEIVGLNEGEYYTYVVQVYASSGISTSSKVSQTFSVVGSDEVTDIKTTPCDSSSVIVSWGRPISFGTGGFVSYTIFAIDDNLNVISTVVIKEESKTSASVTGLVPGNKYRYAVSVTNNGGINTFKSSDYFTFDSPLQIRSITWPTATSINISWNPITLFTGIPYTITATSAVSPTLISTAASSSGTLSGLVKGKTYAIVVSAKSVHNKIFLSPAPYVITTSPPGIPTITSVVFKTGNAITVAWTPSPSLNNGIPPTLTYSVSVTDSVTKAAVVSGTTDGLTSTTTLKSSVAIGSKKSYIITVTASNIIGSTTSTSRTFISNAAPAALLPMRIKF